MMNTETLSLGGAALIALMHTLAGPDHYLPFIVLSKARGWTMIKTVWITALCGLGHVGSSIVIGLVGIFIGKSLAHIEVMRGDWAAWAFMIFGLAYMLWGIYKAIQNKPHQHVHIHDDGSVHTHLHTHSDKHKHEHNKILTPWALFIIFVLGPCEPLFAYFTISAVNSNGLQLVHIALVFSVITILSMVAIVVLSVFGLNLLPLKFLERYIHVTAGLVIFLSGAAIKFMGL